MAFGAAGYYVLLAEPILWPFALALVATIAVGWLLRKHWLAIYVALLVGMGLFGFVNAGVHTQLFSHTVLAEPVFWKQISGTVKAVQLDEGQQKVVLTQLTIDTLPPEKTPTTIRITFKKPQSTTIKAGDELSVKATLFPLPDPVAPGAFDFARHLYFQGLDAVGYTTAQADITQKPPGLWHHINRFRVEFASALIARLDPPTGSIAAALTVGEQQAVPDDVNDLLRDSGLYHILSISGLHMSLAAGLMFFFIRALLATWPYLALNYPIKKIAAMLALCSSFFYLLAAGAPVPAVRSFIMVAMVFIAMMVDRKGISFYALCWAAFFIILFQPHAVVSASFQLSFAATAAIVALYEGCGKLLYQPSHGIIRKLSTAVFATILVSLVATLATAPFVITHFNRMQWWGMLSNAAASPLTAFVIMPGVVLSFLGWPFGLEGLGFWLMEWGIRFMIIISEWVAALPYASVYMPSFHPVGFVLGTLGLCVFLLIRSYLRLVGLVMLLFAATTMTLYQPPHIFIGERAKQIAVTDAAGNLVMLKGKPDSFLGDAWARLHGSEQATKRNEAVWNDQISGGCEKEGCWYNRDNHRIAFVIKPKATDRLCKQTNATMLVFNYTLYEGECTSATKVIDRARLNAAGSMDIRFDEAGEMIMRDASVLRGKRPWIAR